LLRRYAPRNDELAASLDRPVKPGDDSCNSLADDRPAYAAAALPVGCVSAV
jgi:hypothetical protein